MSFEQTFLWLFGVVIFFVVLYFVIYNAVKDAILNASEEKMNKMNLKDKSGDSISDKKCETNEQSTDRI